jgi:tRNA-modifying protein YgfZ
VNAYLPSPSPLLSRPGAVPAEGVDAGVAWHYGDPVAEQRRLEEGVGAVDLSHRGVVRITGPDRLDWMHALTSQQLTGLAPEVSTETLVLSPHGHIEHAPHLVDDGEALWLGVEPGAAPELADWLDRMRFLLRVEVADVSAQYAVVGEPVGGPETAGAGEASAERGTGDSPPDPGVVGAVAVWVDPWPARGPDTASYAAVGEDTHPGRHRRWREVILPRPRLAEYLDGRPLAGTWAAEALRVAAWRPRAGVDTDHRTIPHELDWLRTAVHLHKGCYRGQETVARVHNLGHPPRRLVLLHLDGSENVLPGHGDPVMLDDRTVGQVTTAVRHHELGPVALALVRRATPVPATLTVAGIPAAQEPVVAP